MISLILFVLVFFLAAVFLGVFKGANYRNVSGKVKGAGLLRPIGAAILFKDDATAIPADFFY